MVGQTFTDLDIYAFDKYNYHKHGLIDPEPLFSRKLKELLNVKRNNY